MSETNGKQTLSTVPASLFPAEELRLPALEVRQGRNRTLYSFAVDGKLIPSFADDMDGMLRVVMDFWKAVKVVFDKAWKKPRESRLLHGAGVLALGFVMDATADRHRHQGLPTFEQFRTDLEPLKWTKSFSTNCQPVPGLGQFDLKMARPASEKSNYVAKPRRR